VEDEDKATSNYQGVHSGDEEDARDGSSSDASTTRPAESEEGAADVEDEDEATSNYQDGSSSGEEEDARDFASIGEAEDADSGISNATVGRRFVREFNGNMLFNLTSNQLCFWDPQDQTWNDDPSVVLSYIYDTLTHEITMAYQQDLPQREAKQLEKLKSDAFLRATTNWVTHVLKRRGCARKKVEFNLEEVTKHYFQFRNGAFNLQTGELQPRTMEMYVTKYLDFNYRDERDQGKMTRLMHLMQQILPDEKWMEGFLAWRGYCLTGETREQCFVHNVGFTAENGKSTLSFMFRKAFPLYSKQIPNDCFDKGSHTSYDKTFASLAGLPVRLAFMEEYGSRPQDPDKVKSAVGSGMVAVKPLYQEARELRIQFKLEASSNRDLNVDRLDTGLNRRGCRFPFTSQFVTDPTKVDEAAHRYLCDKSIESLFDGSDGSAYSLALFHLYAPYAQRYYAYGLQLPTECNADFVEAQAAIVEAQAWDPFFKTHTLESKGSFAFKKRIEALVKQHFVDRVFEWSAVVQEFQKRGFVYDSKKDTHIAMERFKGAFRDCLLLDAAASANGADSSAMSSD
jgi:hypothetical protein